MTDFKRFAKMYEQLKEIPDAPTVGFLHESNDGVKSFAVKFTQADLRDAKKKGAQNYFVAYRCGHADGTFEAVGNASEVPSDAVLVAHSRSGKLTAAMRIADGKEQKNHEVASIDFVLEIWERTRRTAHIAVQKMHKNVYADNYVGYLAWSDDETKLAWVAEEKSTPATSYFSDSRDCSDKPVTAADEAMIGHEYDAVFDWGETHVGRSNGRIFVCDRSSNSNERAVIRQVGAAHALLAGQSLGSPVFSADGKSMAFLGWATEPRRLGLVHCFNRRSKLYVATGDNYENIRCVSAPDALCARSPRFSPDGAMLVYLTVHDLDAHNSCSSLRACALATDAHSVIVDVVDTPASPDAFPGLYLGALPSNAFVGDHTLVLSTPWRAMVRAVAVDVRTRSIEMLFADLNESVTVLDARRNALLMSTSSPTQVPRTTLARWTPSTNVWTRHVGHADADERTRRSLADTLTAQIVRIDAPPDAFQLEYIFIAPRDTQQKCGVMLFPHGGPHATTTFSYVPGILLFALAGYAIVAPNYRGSTGYGNKSLLSLLGRIGTLDVDDSLFALNDALKRFAFLDPARKVYFGGSHGGFIGGLVTARDDVKFNATILRNPVIDVGTMSTSTDIPDWCLAECRTTNIEAMRACSPIAHVSKATRPILLLLGDSDKRVPPTQGLQYFHALTAAGNKNVVIKVYPGEGHAISKAHLEGDAVVTSVTFLTKHDSST